MNKFNLLREPWIKVMTNDRGHTKEVSLLEIFSDTQEYKSLAGETRTQDFAIMRLLLAILYTVFSRFNSEGEIYSGLELDEKLRQVNTVDEFDFDEYGDQVIETWRRLWEKRKVPDIVQKYLKVWEEHFNLFDDSNPFYQVSSQQLSSIDIDYRESTKLQNKFINRLISESNNKTELFSPYAQRSKNDLTVQELARWLVAFQGYTGTSDKTKFPKMKKSANRGWLLSIGSIYLEGDNLYETIHLNLDMLTILSSNGAPQTPIWEKSFEKKINDLVNGTPQNTVDLFTNNSRLIVIDRADKENEGINIHSIQVPGVGLESYTLEPMTLWQYPKSGPNKHMWVPRAHNPNAYLWESFGLVSLADGENTKQPGIIQWINYLVSHEILDERTVTLVSVGHGYNRDPSSMLNSDLFDKLNINDTILIDSSEIGWVPRINEEVNNVKYGIESIYRNLINDIFNIRNTKNNKSVQRYLREAYYEIDLPFRFWLENIREGDSKDEKIREWREIFKEIILSQADLHIRDVTNRDYLGIQKNDETFNIISAYNIFQSRLNKLIKEGLSSGSK